MLKLAAGSLSNMVLPLNLVLGEKNIEHCAVEVDD